MFLLYCLDVLLMELCRSLDTQHQQLLHHTLEQISFCLYSHPSKKSKVCCCSYHCICSSLGTQDLYNDSVSLVTGVTIQGPFIMGVGVLFFYLQHKHLRDHGVPQIALCWERALQLYHYYCPTQLPDFQSSQIPSITDDVASFLKR